MRNVTDRERSQLLQMAGNIAAGLAARADYNPHASSDEVVGQPDIAKDSVAIALAILEDPRLLVRTGLPAEER